jgi:uncharacterized protein YecA (UPF0149 family)
MGIADIHERQSEERKREKRLVHLTNELCREFISTSSPKAKVASSKNDTEYILRSFLDYVFFHDHKEIREINEQHVQHFMIEFAPRKMDLAPEMIKDTPEILSQFFTFLHKQGHIKNGDRLVATVRKEAKDFIASFPKPKKTAPAKAKTSAPAKKTPKKIKTDPKVGRNDPCPCGSGKKFKKCCGKQ